MIAPPGCKGAVSPIHLEWRANHAAERGMRSVYESFRVTASRIRSLNSCSSMWSS